MRILILVIILIITNNNGASQVTLLNIEEYPEGSFINHIESDGMCYYYVTTINDLDYPESDRLHTSVLIDDGCDLDGLEVVDLRDFVTDNGDYEPEMLFRLGNFFAEFMNYRDLPNGIVVGEFILYDEDLNYIKSDTFPITLNGLYPVQRSDKHQFIGLKTYPSPFVSTIFEFSALDSSITAWEVGPTFISSMLYDQYTNQYLIYYLGGLGKLDTFFNVIDLIHATFAHTGVLGKLSFWEDKVISFGARLPPFVSKWQLTFNLYERDLTLLVDESYGDTSQSDYPFLKHCLTQSDDAIFTGAELNTEEDSVAFHRPIEFVITKYDHDRNLIWRHNYGGDAAYGMFGLRATSEGGCVAYGNRRNDKDGLRYPFLIEIDRNGLLTSAEKITDNAHSFVLYGNPVSEELRIHAEFSPLNSYSLLLVDGNGHIIFQKNLSPGMNVLDVRKLPHGNYFYSILDLQSQRIVEASSIAILR